MTLRAGMRLGPYEVLGPLGAGGMGEVFRARDTRLWRDVALKVLPSALVDDVEGRARSEREARVLAALSHPRMATIHDVLDADGRPAIVMELVAGRPLDQVVAAGRLAVRPALDCAVHVADALSAAHEAGIVHRGLKPANGALPFFSHRTDPAPRCRRGEGRPLGGRGRGQCAVVGGDGRHLRRQVVQRGGTLHEPARCRLGGRADPRGDQGGRLALGQPGAGSPVTTSAAPSR